MDIARALEIITANARYQKPIVDDSKESYDNLVWLDARPKPKWDELFDAWAKAIEYETIFARVAELKKLLSDSDFRMTQDYYGTMSSEQKLFWTNERQTWRDEIYQLESKLK